jgi:Fe-S cluster biosynthesis and repair protein YggX
LQLADLLAYPSKQEILVIEKRIDKLGLFNKQIRKVIQSKYNQQIYEGKIKGYGRIFLK